MRALIVVAVLVFGTVPENAETLTCATSFQGYRVCQGPGGYRSTEWDRQDETFGQDSDGARWSTSRSMGIDTTTVEPSGR